MDGTDFSGLTMMDHRVLSELLALGGDWEVAGVRWCGVTKSLFVSLRPLASFWASQGCPQCGGAVREKGRPAGQSWRHLDCLGARTILLTELPKAVCADCRGAFRLSPAWQGRLPMFTRAFEAMALRLIGNTSVSAAVKSLQETEQRIWRLLFAYVESVDGRLSSLAINAVRKEWKRPRVLNGGLLRPGRAAAGSATLRHASVRTLKETEVNQ